MLVAALDFKSISSYYVFFALGPPWFYGGKTKKQTIIARFCSAEARLRALAYVMVDSVVDVAWL